MLQRQSQFTLILCNYILKFIKFNLLIYIFIYFNNLFIGFIKLILTDDKN